MARTMSLSGKTAVVTGAASGIGRALSLSLARRGCRLALADMNAERLAETAAMTHELGSEVTEHRLDVTDKAAVAAFPSAVLAEHGGADMLFNNAGVTVGGTFEQVDEGDFEWLFEVNFWGVVRMTRAFLPLLHASREGWIVNVSSLFGLIAVPGQAAYCASKFAVRGFTESLRQELKGANIGVTVVHPGGVATNIAKSARRPKGDNTADLEERIEKVERLLTMPPDRAAEIIVTGVERRSPRILVGRDAHAASLVQRLRPASYMDILSKRMDS